MNDNNEHIRRYKAEDIRRYAQGEMSDAEMHAIEKAALEDEFLADAIDGFSDAVEAHGMHAVQASALELQTRLDDRINKKKRNKVVPVVRVKWWQAAAAAAIIVTAGILGYRSYTDRAGEILFSKNEADKSSLARQTDSGRDLQKAEIESSASRLMPDSAMGVVSAAENETAKPGSVAASSSRSLPDAVDKTKTAPTSKPVDTQSPEKLSGITARESELQPVDQGKPSSTEVAAAPVRVAPAANGIRTPGSDTLNDAAPETVAKALSGRAAGVRVDTKKEMARTDKNAAPVNPVLNEVSASDKSALNYYKGQIVTPDNKPVSNAVLKLVNNSASYTTDNNGNFVIPSRDSVIDVNVSMIGSDETSFRLQSNTVNNQLILPTSDNQLSEVVVIGYGTHKKRNITGSVVVAKEAAEPVGGWMAFEQYLESNKDTALLQNGSAETQLSFQVNSKNEYSRFRVTKSISSRHDKEIIRLVKDGPKWKLVKGKKATVTITLRF